MGGGGGGSHARELDQTPTWAVAAVVAIIIVISISMEKILHKIGEWFTERGKKSLYEALEKVKGELMVLGFISLLLTFGQSYISGICIEEELANTMLPCAFRTAAVEAEGHHAPAAEGHHAPAAEGHEPPAADDNHHRRLLFYNDYSMEWRSQRRMLSGGSVKAHCKEGKVPLVSSNALHQLHIFIFFLAVFHVLYSVLTMALGRLKIRGWKVWEQDTESTDYEFSNDPARFRFSHETSFVRLHTSIWTKIPISFYLLCFFRQFFQSVRRADYLTMRHGFIAVHLSPGTKFNFQKYIKRSLEDDCKVIVGISPILWTSLVICLFLNVNGWQAMFWISLIPLIIVLAVGTKLQAIIMNMALEIRERHAVVQGIPLVQIGDKHFWFGRPRLILHLIHFTLFQNAFEIIYFFWIAYEFGLTSCFHENFDLIIARVALGVVVQFLCSYITLPLYALVSQMGSQMKESIFDDQTSKALKKWHHQAMKKKPVKPAGVATRTLGVNSGDSPTETPMAPIHGVNSNLAKDMYDDASPKSQEVVLISGMDDINQDSGSREQEHYKDQYKSA